MLRTIGIGIVALAALLGVLGLVFALGLLRLHLAQNGSGSSPNDRALAPARQPPSSRPATAKPIDPSPPADPQPPPVSLVTTDSIELAAEKAALNGGLTLDADRAPAVHPKHGHRAVGAPEAPPVIHQAIVGFKDEGQAAEWTAKLTKPGPYEVDVVCACAGPRDQAAGFVVTVNDQELRGDASARGGRENYEVITVGNGTFAAGEVKVRFRLADPARNLQLRLRSIRLIPAT